MIQTQISGMERPEKVSTNCIYTDLHCSFMSKALDLSLIIFKIFSLSLPSDVSKNFRESKKISFTYNYFD